MIVASSLFDAVHPFDGRFRFGLLAHLHLFVAGIVVADLSRTTNLFGRPASFGYDLLLLLAC